MILRILAPPRWVAVCAQTLVPRLWATAWSLSRGGRGLASSTQKMLLGHVDAFYSHCDTTFSPNFVDKSISERDHAAIQQAVDSFYFHLNDAESLSSTIVQRWDAVRGFIQWNADRLAVSNEKWTSLSHYVENIGRLRSRKTGRFKFVRALPTSTLSDLLSVAQPGSERNPFLNEDLQHRNWLVVNLLLLCGLRRGELLLLAVDSLKQDVDKATGELQSWIDVTSTLENDERATKPSIKTEQSHRQLPVSQSLADLYLHYVTEHRRARAAEAHLLTSRDGRALSAEAVGRVFSDLYSVMAEGPRNRFRERTGGKAKISPHDLRHTCATARFSMFMAHEPNRELTLQRMRAFFGWSHTSVMPELYARAAIQEDLVKMWSSVFNQQLDALRAHVY